MQLNRFQDAGEVKRIGIDGRIFFRVQNRKIKGENDLIALRTRGERNPFMFVPWTATAAAAVAVIHSRMCECVNSFKML